MRRREVILLLGGTAVMWPLAAHAQQQTERVRRIGVLMAANDAANHARYAAFVHALQLLGWTEGRNVRIEARFSTGNAADVRNHLIPIRPHVRTDSTANRADHARRERRQ
jgi:putative ABC transport system substrate-binding protein